MTVYIPEGELARATCHEPSSEWPTMIEVVAYWGTQDQPRKGPRRSILIPADEFFGRGSYGAPITGDRMVGMIDQLRRSGPGKA